MCEIKEITKQSPIEWKGQVVITTAQLAEVYGTTAKNITNNFQRNKERFCEGKHYFILTGDCLKDFKSKTSERGSAQSSSNTMYLWTRRGASRHCKILGTDKAWEQFDYLEETYFAVQQQAIDRQNLSPTMQMTLQMVESMARQELEQKRQAVEIENIKESQQAITETFQKQPEDDFKTWVNKCVGKIAESNKYPFRGSDKDKYKQIRYESYERLNKKKPCRLNQRVEAEKGRAFSAGASTTKISAINKLTIIEGDKALKPIYETVIKEMMIAYCVN